MTSFPAFIRAEYDGSGRGFRDFESAFQDSVGRQKRNFEKAFTEAGAIAGKAIQRGLKGGALDLGLPDMRQALAQQRAYAASLDVTAKAAASLAAASGDTTRATQDYVQGLRAAAIQAQEQADATDRNVLSYTRLQAEITRTAGANDRLKQSYRDLYAEQAKAENAAFAAQRAVNSAVAPGLSNRATDNGATFAALERQAQRQDALSQATDNYKRKVTELTQQLFPLEAQTARVTQQITLLETAYRRGDISAEQLAEGQQRLNQSLTQLRGGFRDTRQGLIQTGQQLQDVAISMIGGQRAGTVLAQQLPQLAFAMSNFGGKVGAVATVLSGPYSLALVAGSFLLGNLVDSLFRADDATKKAKSSSIDFGNTLVAQTGAVSNFTDAIEQLDSATRGLINTQSLLADNLSAFSRTSARNVEISIGALKRQKEDLESQRRGAVGSFFLGEDRAVEAQIKKLNDDLAVEQSKLARFRQSGAAASVALERRAAQEAIDPVLRERNAIERERARLEQQRLRTIQTGGRGPTTRERFLAGDAARNGESLSLSPISASEFGRQLALLDAREKALEESQKKTRERSGRKRGGAGSAEREAAKALRDSERLSKGLDEQEQTLARIQSQFDQAPRDIDRATDAQTELNQVIARTEKLLSGKLSEDQRAAAERAIAAAKQTRDVTIPDFLKRPIDDRVRAGEEQIAIQQLLVRGREDEAEALELQFDIMRQLGVKSEEALRIELERRKVSDAQYQSLFAQRQTMRDLAREEERLIRSGRHVRAQLQEIDRFRSNIEQTFADLPDNARGALKGFIGDVRKQANEAIARSLTDDLFGDFFKQLEDEATGRGKVRDANEQLAKSSDETRASIIELGRAASQAAAQVSGRAANDNGLPGGIDSSAVAEIVVQATRSTPASLVARVVSEVAGKNSDLGQQLKKLTDTALKGGFAGQTASGLVFGNKGSATGSFIGGAIGQQLGEAVGKSIGGALGNFAGPIGGALGGLVGGALIGAFKKPKTGSATIGGSGSSLGVASFSGNNAKFKQAAGDSADSAISTIERIAAELGGSVDASRGSVSIGIRDGKFRVDNSGRGITKTKKGAIDFGEDAEAAVRAATLDLIRDGVLTGLRASTNRILQQGKDLDAAVQKALDFESVFTRLKAIKDPVGAALDTLDKEFVRLQKIFKEAGASTEEYAQLEELYGIERAKAIKEAGERATASLKGLFDELTVGNDARSLRTRLGLAQAQYDPLAARVRAGDTAAYDDFAEAARQLLDIQRQFSGSQSPYFDLLDEVTALTKARIEAETNVANIAAGRDSPFDNLGNATGAANDNASVVAAIDRQTEQLTQNLLQGWARIMTESVRADLSSDFRFSAFV